MISRHLCAIRLHERKTPCPKCQSPQIVKNGKALGKQRDKCNLLLAIYETDYSWPACTRKGYGSATLYTQGLSIRAIARLIGVSPTTVLKWIKLFAKTHSEQITNGVP